MKKHYIVYDIFKYVPEEVTAVMNNIEFCTDKKEVADRYKSADALVIPGIVLVNGAKKTKVLWFSVKDTNYRRAFICVSKIRKLCDFKTARESTKAPVLQYFRYREMKFIKKRGAFKNGDQ